MWAIWLRDGTLNEKLCRICRSRDTSSELAALLAPHHAFVELVLLWRDSRCYGEPHLCPPASLNPSNSTSSSNGPPTLYQAFSPLAPIAGRSSSFTIASDNSIHVSSRACVLYSWKFLYSFNIKSADFLTQQQFGFKVQFHPYIATRSGWTRPNPAVDCFVV